MARYVVLEFENNTQAERFVTSMQENPDICTLAPSAAHPVGMFFKPTQFCECPTPRKGRAYTRGKKWGVWVCAQCMKPSQAFADGKGWFYHLGNNLLEEDGGYDPAAAHAVDLDTDAAHTGKTYAQNKQQGVDARQGEGALAEGRAKYDGAQPAGGDDDELTLDDC